MLTLPSVMPVNVSEANQLHVCNTIYNLWINRWIKSFNETNTIEHTATHAIYKSVTNRWSKYEHVVHIEPPWYDPSKQYMVLGKHGQSEEYRNFRKI